MITPTPQTPTQVRYPWKAAARTAIQAFLSFAGLLAVTLPIALPFLAEYLPPSWIGFLVAAGVFVAGLAAVIARIMALPQLQTFLTSIHLGATPKP
ncbi:MAG TPA: hypothetical protein VIL55_16705 [Naasia sp.]|jgi:hypothetical protein